ncbi:unnamed protein product, partial [Discosporangium mesarthrocarpum]
LHLTTWIPIILHRFTIPEADLRAQLYAALDTDSLSVGEVLAHLEMVAARLSCRRQRRRDRGDSEKGKGGRDRVIVSRAKRVPAERGMLVYRVCRRFDDGVLYFVKVYRSSEDMTVACYEPKTSSTIRTVVPFRGSRGLGHWLSWELDDGRRRRQKELLRRLGEAQKA